MRPFGRPDEAARLRSLIHGYRGTAILYAFVKSGLADAMSKGPRSSMELAAALGLHAPTVLRVLRGLAVLGAVEPRANGSFALAEMGRMLVSPGVAAAELIVSIESNQPAWAGLVHSLRTGEVAHDAVRGESVWQHRARSPELNRSFDAWMAAHTRLNSAGIARLLEPRAGSLVADVGGGEGILLAAVLAQHPLCRGLLFDQPGLAAAAARTFAEQGVADRARFMGGDAFQSLGFQADMVVLKSVLHDWDDARCLALLRQCQDALLPDGVLCLVERLLPEDGSIDPMLTWMDLQMLAVTGGRERTLPEFTDLLGQVGLRVASVRRAPSGHALLEARRA